MRSQSTTKTGELDVSMTTARPGRPGKECSLMGMVRVKVRSRVKMMVKVGRADGGKVGHTHPLEKVLSTPSACILFKSLPWELFNHLPIVFRLNLCKRFHISGPHTLLPGYYQRVICIGPVSNLNAVLVFNLPVCLTHIVPSTSVKVDKLDPATCVEKNIGLSQITKDVSLFVQSGQNLLNLLTSIPWWFKLSVDIIHNNHMYVIQAKARWSALIEKGRFIGLP